MKILSTYFNSFIVARHAVVVCPSTMPRHMGYNTHDASQALANISNYTYTSLWMQITLDRVITIRLPRKQRIGVASQAYRGIRCRQGIGFASAIEIKNLWQWPFIFVCVARGLASRLRLKY